MPTMNKNERLEQARLQDIATIKQMSSGRFLVGQYGGDWNVVTSGSTAPPLPSGADPRWIMTSQGVGIYTFHRLFAVQGGTGKYARYIDAHEIGEKDFNVVTRERQTFDKTQLWQLIPKGGDIFEIVQVSSGRFMDAHEIPEMNYRVVTRPRQNNPTQLWKVTRGKEDVRK
jgi:hypothetical protein